MKIKTFIKKVENHFFNDLVRIGFFNKMSDKAYLQMQFKRKIHKKLNLENPKTFNEKIQWLKLNNKNPEFIKMVDKYEAKQYVKNIIGEKYIINTIGIYNSFEEIDFSALPNKFVIKCTHDSGGIVICKDKNQLDIKKTRRKINKFLKRNYFYSGREWPYKNIKPRILIEDYMEDHKNEDLIDYKFMCFNGKVKCEFVCSERRSSEGLAVDFFDTNWNHLPFERHYRNLNKKIEKPSKLEEMIELAEKLASNIPFIRVDFYEINGDIYFGELTFFPGSGFEEFNPEEYDEKMGSWLVLPNS